MLYVLVCLVAFVVWAIGGFVIGFVGFAIERWVLPWLGTGMRIPPHPRLKLTLAILVAVLMMFVWTVGVALTGWWVATPIPSSSALAAAAPVAGSPAAPPADSGSGSGSGYVVPSPESTVPSGPTPPSGYVWCWFGRQGRGESIGFNVEYIVQMPADYNGTLELWAEINGSLDEWGNDSLKGCEPVRTWLDASDSFPRASWLDLPQNYVCEDDNGICSGTRWNMTSSSNIPEGYNWLTNSANNVDLPVYYDVGLTRQVLGVRIIRWIETSQFPY